MASSQLNFQHVIEYFDTGERTTNSLASVHARYPDRNPTHPEEGDTGESTKTSQASVYARSLTEAYARLLRCARGQGRSAREVKKALTAFTHVVEEGSTFRRNRQNDATEFGKWLLDKMFLVGVDSSQLSPGDKSAQSFFRTHFQGTTETTLQCTGCNQKRVVDIGVEYSSLELPIEQSRGETTLARCFDIWARDMRDVECLDCDKRCIPHNSTLQLLTVPDVLILLLKRYDNHSRKLETTVEFPVALDLQRWGSRLTDGEDLKYEVSQGL